MYVVILLTFVILYSISDIFGLTKSTLQNLGRSCWKMTIYTKRLSAIKGRCSLSTEGCGIIAMSSTSGLVSFLFLEKKNT